MLWRTLPHGSFADEEELEEHLHHGARLDEPHAFCKVCQTWFMDVKALSLHQDLQHPSCSFCNRQFNASLYFELLMCSRRCARGVGVPHAGATLWACAAVWEGPWACSLLGAEWAPSCTAALTRACLAPATYPGC